MISTELSVACAVERYEADGWCDVPQPLPIELVARVRKRIEAIARTRRSEVTYENGSNLARAIHGCHRYDEVCMELVTSSPLVNLAEAITKSEVYVYQFKVNVKSAHEGKRWPWHQDFTFWNQEDDMPMPDAVTIAVNLDRVHDDNGPLTVLAGSHKLGMLESCAMKEKSFRSNWQDDVSENLSHKIPDGHPQ